MRKTTTSQCSLFMNNHSLLQPDDGSTKRDLVHLFWFLRLWTDVARVGYSNLSGRDKEGYFVLGDLLVAPAWERERMQEHFDQDFLASKENIDHVSKPHGALILARHNQGAFKLWEPGLPLEEKLTKLARYTVGKQSSPPGFQNEPEYLALKSLLEDAEGLIDFGEQDV